MSRKRKKELKRIALDVPTMRFLKLLRQIRKDYGIRAVDVAKQLGVTVKTIHRYENGSRMPLLGNLIKIAEIYGYNLEESVNYKFYYREKFCYDMKKAMFKYNFNYGEISKIIGYSKSHVTHSVNLKKDSGLPCISAVLEAIAKEDKQFKYREKMLQNPRKRS